MAKADLIKNYKAGDLTVFWKPSLCIHSEKCVHGLPEVFKPTDKPWIRLEGTSEAKVIAQVKKCPSGALSFISNIKNTTMDSNQSSDHVRVEVIPDGPLAVHSSCSISHSNGTIEQKPKKAFFCRCGGSANKPYCDGTHKKIEFKG